MMDDANRQPRFPLSMRILHWLMAAMVLSMLFIGAAMVSSLANYHRLVSIHRPLGILVLVVVIIRYVNRKFSRLPPFPVTMSQRERHVAQYYELLLYTLMFVMPLIGWAMLSAGNYPIVMYGPVHLPPILPASPVLYAILRRTHTILAYVLFATFLVHFSLVMFHTLVVRDRLLRRMLA
jgi:cytochrome b561